LKFGVTISETKDGTFYVNVVGDWIPRHILGYFHALFAYIRMIYIALYLILLSSLKPDVIFCDQVSACVPLLRYVWQVMCGFLP